MALGTLSLSKNLPVMEFELEINPLTSLKEHQTDTVPALFADECHHIPSHYFSHSSKSRDFYISVRREAVSFILKAQFSCNFDPFIPYLAISYIDRFISKQEILRNRWMVKLLTISCLSIAAKMKNTELLLSDLQRDDEGFISDAKSIRRMELLVLSTLNWRMRPVTPFSFLHFFLSSFELRHPLSIESLKDRASEFIFKSHYEMKVLEYKPSIIAASALLCASQVLFPMEFPCFRAAIASCEYVNKEKLLSCLAMMEETEATDTDESQFDAVASGTKTPVSVLDRLLCCTPTQSETTATSSGTMITESDSIIKRRKINGPDLSYSTLLRSHATEFSGMR
ncbi:putative cyclin-D6-1 isoform X2 [Rhododendron vialii]|uniref:putative cyclin-D6-1 isoform X2 n=1 Tax=Rhododendron vialii TaxID=182163 RepID=UPI00265F6AF4|nr:putative cyclin-D6-1 isoform X2 [Rhododendron vialii]